MNISLLLCTTSRQASPSMSVRSLARLLSTLSVLLVFHRVEPPELLLVSAAVLLIVGALDLDGLHGANDPRVLRQRWVLMHRVPEIISVSSQ